MCGDIVWKHSIYSHNIPHLHMRVTQHLPIQCVVVVSHIKHAGLQRTAFDSIVEVVWIQSWCGVRQHSKTPNAMQPFFTIDVTPCIFWVYTL